VICDAWGQAPTPGRSLDSGLARDDKEKVELGMTRKIRAWDDKTKKQSRLIAGSFV